MAPLSDLITGTVLYNKLCEDVLSGKADRTFTEYRILFFLANVEGGRARIHALAESLILNTSTVSDAVKALESAGFIEKDREENDLKAIWAIITKAGREEFVRCSDALLEGTNEYWNSVGAAIREKYFTYGVMLTHTWKHPLQAAHQLPKPVFYSFISKWHLSSYVSWFKSTYNLSLIDVRILMLLLEREEAITCGDIAYLLRVSNSAVSSSLRRLSRIKKYIARDSATSNRETKNRLTDEGAERIHEIRNRFILFNMEQFGMSSEEFENMLLATFTHERKNYMQKIFGSDFTKNH